MRILFDLDGTLIDSVPDLRALANRVLAGEGCAPITLEQARDFVGSGAPVFVRRMRAACGIPDSEQDRLYRAFLDGYETAVDLTRPWPGVPEALEALKGAGHRLGVATNKPWRPACAVLDHLGLSHVFDTVLGGDSLATRKPDPTMLHDGFAALGGGLRLFVGDSEIDAETAHAAGVPFLLYAHGYRKAEIPELRAEAVFDHFADLPELVAATARAHAL
ncbi:phosphoglycolate phosphatase [Celeribacter indicus]|uniref:phosphoglycolate phosphatase n=1 Tax=Celeribacter indicus TaxID=1208324 RepID=A0A0B5DT08_9RHOB|nr:phosphoglycolate phosphatase [Celeribacter indicus]AJE46164.1 phosphoglycolate phosphatase [Celeribacter indicus]SDX36474.1 phosphoglycolate phosphatase [Celeribacter indicus]